ncbi:MAG: hypothetical protein Kow0099_04950 [Candidatus Abyssubacteria bacterium]
MNFQGEGSAGVGAGGRLRAWAPVFLMMVFILVSLPLTPSFWRAGRRHLGQGFDALGYVVFLLIGLVVVVYLVRRRREFGVLRYSALALLTLVYVYLLHRSRFPAERLHLMEYGFLAYLCWRAFRVDFTTVTSYALGFVLSSAFGLVDELVQYVLPNRYFELRDVATNIIASALGLMVASLLRRRDASPLEQCKGD